MSFKENEVASTVSWIHRVIYRDPHEKGLPKDQLHKKQRTSQDIPC